MTRAWPLPMMRRLLQRGSTRTLIADPSLRGSSSRRSAWKITTLLLAAVAFSSVSMLVSVCLSERSQQRQPTLLVPTGSSLISCPGKALIMKILSDAGALPPNNVSAQQELCRKAPSWRQVVALYGPDPVVIGLETCAQYRSLFDHSVSRSPSAMSDNSTVPRPMVRIAGLFNSGTNAFGHLLNLNLEDLGHQQNYDVVRVKAACQSTRES
jgi:hypothetical protein